MQWNPVLLGYSRIQDLSKNHLAGYRLSFSKVSEEQIIVQKYIKQVLVLSSYMLIVGSPGLYL